MAPGLAVLLAASDRPEEARALLDEATGLGGDPARAMAEGYPVLAALADKRASDA